MCTIMLFPKKDEIRISYDNKTKQKCDKISAGVNYISLVNQEALLDVNESALATLILYSKPGIHKVMNYLKYLIEDRINCTFVFYLDQHFSCTYGK